MHEQELIVRSFIHQNPLATIATVNEHGLPELASVYVTTLGEGLACYFVTKPSTRKFRNITKYQSAALAITGEEELSTADMAGKVSVVTEIEETVQAVQALQSLVAARRKDYWIPPVSQIEGNHFAVCRFDPTRITYTHYPATKENEISTFVITLPEIDGGE